MSRSALTTVLNPKGWLIQTVDGSSGGSADVSCLRKTPANALEGKTVYLVDTGFGRSFKGAFSAALGDALGPAG